MDVDGPAAFSVVNTAFRTHFGHVEETFEGWLAQQESDDTWDPTLGLLAEVDGTIVGYSNNGVIDGVGYVFELGVLPEMQGRGIGRALLRHSFADAGGAWGLERDDWGSTRRTPPERSSCIGRSA